MRLLVTGTSGGIGGAVARLARTNGWEVVEINRTDWDDLRLSGAFDAVVFATGTCPIRPAALMSEHQFEETLRVNCGLFFRLMNALLGARLFSKNGARVIAISSVSAREGWAGGVAYCASKGALSAMCRAFDVELKAKKISVKALEPRYVKTRMFDMCAGRMGVPDYEARSPDDMAAEILRELTL